MTETDTSTATSDQDGRDIPWRRTANVVGVAVLIAIVVPFVVFAVPQVVGADQSYVVLSGSMEPAMSPGDVIIVNSVPASAIERNDVITFGGQGGDTPTTHRVIDVVEQDGTTAFRTQGDANEDPDGSLVTPDQLQGKVLSPGGYLLVIPLIGYLINFAGTQSGFALFVALPVLLLVLNEIWNVIASARSTPNTGGNSSAETTADAAAATTADTSEGEPTEPSRAETTEATGQHNSTAAASDEADAGISFTAAELQLGLGVNAAFLAYSIWVAYSLWTAYDTVETWALGVAGGVGASLLLLGGLYVFGGADDATDEAETDSGSISQQDQPVQSANETAATHDNGDIIARAEASDDPVPQRTNGDGQRASSKGDDGDSVAETSSSGGETDA
ncbi:peptidase S26B, signal peptidase [Halorubrum saccharovorum DSM 1137]|uniref:Peptidase S26B, signal peptidase n=1 Tax=Halorubrum saccharovorum DSM 1137 TaxID=1227484 RepID=M0E607_9EURY|nr:signal peptidase I [Halorubrum saccharovorum]ELZ42352.1 peptidase S26B, signal peptidase [Halorubrum saccharovorum DSM 1137]